MNYLTKSEKRKIELQNLLGVLNTQEFTFVDMELADQTQWHHRCILITDGIIPEGFSGVAVQYPFRRIEVLNALILAQLGVGLEEMKTTYQNQAAQNTELWRDFVAMTRHLGYRRVNEIDGCSAYGRFCGGYGQWVDFFDFFIQDQFCHIVLLSCNSYRMMTKVMEHMMDALVIPPPVDPEARVRHIYSLAQAEMRQTDSFDIMWLTYQQDDRRFWGYRSLGISLGGDVEESAQGMGCVTRAGIEGEAFEGTLNKSFLAWSTGSSPLLRDTAGLTAEDPHEKMQEMSFRNFMRGSPADVSMVALEAVPFRKLRVLSQA